MTDAFVDPYSAGFFYKEIADGEYVMILAIPGTTVNLAQFVANVRLDPECVNASLSWKPWSAKESDSLSWLPWSAHGSDASDCFHRGYYRTLQRLRPCLDEIIANLTAKGVPLSYVTGHSQGGAVSTLYHHLKDRALSRHGVVTFD